MRTKTQPKTPSLRVEIKGEEQTRTSECMRSTLPPKKLTQIILARLAQRRNPRVRVARSALMVAAVVVLRPQLLLPLIETGSPPRRKRTASQSLVTRAGAVVGREIAEAATQPVTTTTMSSMTQLKMGRPLSR